MDEHAYLWAMLAVGPHRTGQGSTGLDCVTQGATGQERLHWDVAGQGRVGVS